MATFLYLYREQSSIIESIPHCHTENALKRRKGLEMWLQSYTEDKVGISVIVSNPHCHTEIALKRVKNREMWLPFCIENEVLSLIVFHTVILKMF